MIIIIVVSKSIVPPICSRTDTRTMTVPSAFSQKLCSVIYGMSFKAAGTRYEKFNHEYATKMSYAYEQFYAEAKKRRLAKAEVSREEFHVAESDYAINQ